MKKLICLVSGVILALASHGADARSGRGREKVTVMIPPPPVQESSGTRKIFFELENDDDCDAVPTRYNRYSVKSGEPCTAGFAELILENTGGIFSMADQVESADVIVYARVTIGKNGKAIADALAAGKTVIASGEIPDREVAALAPLSVGKFAGWDYYRRYPLVVKSGTKLFAGVKRFSTAKFPVNSDVRLNRGAETLITLADSTPFLARKGNFYHFSGTVGQTVEKSEVFFDKFLLRLAAGERAGELDKRESELAAARIRAEEALVSAALNAAQVSGSGWQPGAASNNYGRFGWRIAVGTGHGFVNNDLSFSFGKQSFKLTPASAKKLDISVDELNWTGRLCRVDTGKERFTVRHSLLLPFIRYSFESGTPLKLALKNTADSAAWLGADGKVVIRKFTEGKHALFDPARDGKWSSPWLLLFRSGDTRPLALWFPGTLASVDAVAVNAEAIELVIRQEGKDNTVICGMPYGVKAVNSSGWANALPENLLKRLELGGKLAFNYPENSHQIFRIDRKAEKIEVIDHFINRHTPNVWGIAPYQYAFVPPLSAFLAGKGRYVRFEEKVTDFDIPGAFGPAVGVSGKNAVRYSFDLPVETDFQVPGFISPRHNELANLFFANGVKWSAGNDGGVKFEAWSVESPSEKFKCRNIDMFGWNFGLNSAIQGMFTLDKANTQKMKNRIRLRFLDPLEKYMWKFVWRHRREPFSGISYPIMMQLSFPLRTPFAPGTGSKISFADNNEAHAVFMWMIQQLQDLSGQEGLAESNWNFAKYISRYEMCCDDYLFQSGSCRDFGIGAWIDMLNCEYAGMMAAYRNAVIAGDGKFADQALYRASRRAVPTLARLFFREYLEYIEPERADAAFQITGFGETGAKRMAFPTNNYNFLSAMDLFDFSEGFPGTLISLYDKYAAEKLAEYISKRAYPSLELLRNAVSTNSSTYPYFPPLALYMRDTDKFNEYAEHIISNYHRMVDWPAMRRPFEINMLLWRNCGKVALRDFRDLDIRAAAVDPQKRVLTLDYTAGKNALLTVTSQWQADKVTCNGSLCRISVKDGKLYLPSAPGAYQVTVSFK